MKTEHVLALFGVLGLFVLLFTAVGLLSVVWWMFGLQTLLWLLGGVMAGAVLHAAIYADPPCAACAAREQARTNVMSPKGVMN